MNESSHPFGINKQSEFDSESQLNYTKNTEPQKDVTEQPAERSVPTYIQSIGQIALTMVSDNNQEQNSVLIENNLSELEQSSEFIKKPIHMRYGSERFEGVIANNHNEIHFEDISDAHKLVF